ncbi:hypothetical protein THRCLA_00738 [Thraustotheca clavata]|uniref:Glycosyltransferase n=1 Tax=Thraustotheca clavata TaxID=74557 RepID=A0A1W0AB70_9STRA|nr:hypothetical protein THRCLA_00738 [Thraustotheca clavata]
MCLFDAMVPMAVSLVLELRALGNTDLIQMYHCNGELSPSSQRIIYMMDAHVQIIDGCVAMVEAGILSSGQANDFRSFWIKPLALVHTHLDDVVLIDADDLVFQDVALLWDVPEYKETGTIFFYDREIPKHQYLQNDFTVNGEVMSNLKALYHTFDYESLGLKKTRPSDHLIQSLAWAGDTAHEQDSSIVVINKTKAPKAMEVLWRLVTQDRYRIGFSYGDKELFWLAYELAHTPYFFSMWANTGAARPGNMKEHPDTLCGGLAQWMPIPSSESVLLHINGGYIFNPYVDHDIASLKNVEERLNQLLADMPTHVSKRRKRSKALIKPEDPDNFWPQECLYKRGSEAIRPADIESIKRRIHNAMMIAKIQIRERKLDGI